MSILPPPGHYCNVPYRATHPFPLRQFEGDIQRVPLVQQRISQNDYFFSFYPKDLRIKPFLKRLTAMPDVLRGKISGFSRDSQRRLSFVARNCGDDLTSQFCLTYHKIRPKGDQSKAHLNEFLTTVRHHFPGMKYLWVMEFQARGVVHYHLFSNLSPTRQIRKRLARFWNNITEETEEHRKFHAFPGNFIKWDMGSGNYVAKYLQKMEQKGVPDDYTNCGRFWGNSRGLLPVPYQFTMEEVLHHFPRDQDPVFIAKFLRRSILKCYESALHRIKGRRVNLRRSKRTVLVPFGLALFYQILEYFHKQQPIPF